MQIKCGDLNLEATLNSGQVFGFKKGPDGSFSGNLLGHPSQISHTNGQLSIASEYSHSIDKVRSYFDLSQNLDTVYQVLENELPLRPALKAYRGLRVLRQDPWEALACFILSSNNNVKRIQGIHKNLCAYFSRRAGRLADTFPSAHEIASSHERILRELGLGYRAPFLLHTAKFLSRNDLYLEQIRSAEHSEALSRVLAFPGIGPKVADCVLLYGFHRLDTFPVDVWILRAMRKIYFRNRRVSEQRVHDFGRKRWGAWSGYVQQYIFHGARNGVLHC